MLATIVEHLVTCNFTKLVHKLHEPPIPPHPRTLHSHEWKKITRYAGVYNGIGLDLTSPKFNQFHMDICVSFVKEGDGLGVGGRKKMLVTTGWQFVMLLRTFASCHSLCELVYRSGLQACIIKTPCDIRNGHWVAALAHLIHSAGLPVNAWQVIAGKWVRHA